MSPHGRCLVALRSAALAIALTAAIAACHPEECPWTSRGERIVGGTRSAEGYLPAVGAVVGYSSQSGVVAFCTGTLISERLVLSAAHCVKAIGEPEIIPEGVAIGFFPGVDARAADAVSRILPIQGNDGSGSNDWQAHPEYAGGLPPSGLADDHDIAVLKLKSPTAIAPTKLIRPSAVSSLLQPGTEVVIAGYGVTAPGDPSSNGVQHHGTTTLIEVGASELLLERGARKCIGDSGGPTLVERGGERWLIGVSARSDGSCSTHSIETRVDAYLSWIHSFGEIPCGSGLSPDCETPATPKTLGEPCSQASDCESGLCLARGEERFCSKACELATGCGQDDLECVDEGAAEHHCVPRRLVNHEESGDPGGGCALVAFAAPPLAAPGGLLVGLALLFAARRRQGARSAVTLKVKDESQVVAG